jgi:mannosylglucosylglycerate synthase
LTDKPFKDIRLLIVHFRVGKTDGVSLEIGSWKDIVEQGGGEVALCAGPVSEGADYIIPLLEQQLSPEIFAIDEDSFGGLKYAGSHKTLESAIKKTATTISRQFQKVIDHYRPTHILVSNLFSVGEGLPASKGIADILTQSDIRTIAVLHDFYWENCRYTNPTCPYISKLLEDILPPHAENFSYCCINKIGQAELINRKGIDSRLLNDTLDFDQRSWRKKASVGKYLRSHGISENTLVILQATRIVRRKNIEISIDIAGEIERRLTDTDTPITLYDGRKIDPVTFNVVLLLPGYAEKRDSSYLYQLKKYAREKGVNFIHTGDDLHSKYELFDMYPYADLVTYPSEYEGFGNQLLEAFFAEIPVFIYEYPVFKTDIQLHGFKYFSLGDSHDFNSETGLAQVQPDILDEAVRSSMTVLRSEAAYTNHVEHNRNIAAKQFSFTQTQTVLKELLS